MILVTGGTGFIGSTLIVHLLAAGKCVKAIKRPDSVIPIYLNGVANLEWVDADIVDYFSLEDVFLGISKVYHCAGMISNYPEDRKQLMKINVEGTANLVNHCLRMSVRMVHVSSIATIGRPRVGTESCEKDLWENDGRQSMYAISKYLAEMEVWRGISEGMDAVIVNPSLVISKQAGKRGSGALFYQLKKGLRFFPSGSIGLVDVEDVVKAMILLMDRTDLQGERYILNAANRTYKDLFRQCAAFLAVPVPRVTLNRFVLGLAWRGACILTMLTGKRAAITKETARTSQKLLAFSNQKIMHEIGFEFKPIDETIKEICNTIKNDN
ncbi:Nucleoside-diphosphate-sugar epimerase [bacterium A37T11]|nr:Nucleoside-diphosphate-sugar epimerase [bacterium A37T11]